ncbi:hypothetical protein Tco_1446480 [Tanacetum coccineum]
MPPEDNILPAEEQPLPTVVSPTADLPGYVPESDPKEDPEEDPEEDPANGGDDGDDEDESSDDEEDDDVDIKGVRRGEHLSSCQLLTAVLYPLLTHAPSLMETSRLRPTSIAATPPPLLA